MSAGCNRCDKTSDLTSFLLQSTKHPLPPHEKHAHKVECASLSPCSKSPRQIAHSVCVANHAFFRYFLPFAIALGRTDCLEEDAKVVSSFKLDGMRCSCSNSVSLEQKLVVSRGRPPFPLLRNNWSRLPPPLRHLRGQYRGPWMRRPHWRRFFPQLYRRMRRQVLLPRDALQSCLFLEIIKNEPFARPHSSRQGSYNYFRCSFSSLCTRLSDAVDYECQQRHDRWKKQEYAKRYKWPIRVGY